MKNECTIRKCKMANTANTANTQIQIYKRHDNLLYSNEFKILINVAIIIMRILLHLGYVYYGIQYDKNRE